MKLFYFSAAMSLLTLLVAFWAIWAWPLAVLWLGPMNIFIWWNVTKIYRSCRTIQRIEAEIQALAQAVESARLSMNLDFDQALIQTVEQLKDEYKPGVGPKDH